MNWGRIAIFAAILAGTGLYKAGTLDPWLKQAGLPASGQAIISGTANDAAPALPSEDQAISDKLQPFIVCLNTVNTGLRDQYAKFQTLLDKPDDFAAVALFSFQVSFRDAGHKQVKACLDGLSSGIAAAPAIPDLDAPAKLYADALTKMLPLMDKIVPYYKQKDYRDDKGKKGREFDTQMQPLMAQFNQAAESVETVVRARNATLKQHELAAAEKANGRDFTWHALNLMMVARQVVDGIGAASEGGKIDAGAIKPLEDQLKAAMDAGSAYAAAHPDVKTARGRPPILVDLADTLDRYLTTVKELRRDLDDKKTSAIDSDLDSVTRSFNNVVDRYNSLTNDPYR